MCITDHCNDAEVTTAMLPISVRYLCRNIKCRADFSRYLNRFIMAIRFLPSSKISGRISGYTIALCQISLWCENDVAARQYAVICKQLFNANDRNRGSLSSFRPPTGWGLHRFVWKSQRDLLKDDLSNATTFNPPLFSLVNTFNYLFRTVVFGSTPHPAYKGN